MKVRSRKEMASFFLLFLVAFLLPTASLSDDPLGKICADAGGSDPVSLHDIGDRILSFLASYNETTYIAFMKEDGFISVISFAGSKPVYGLLQCRLDVSFEACTSCAEDAVDYLRAQCPDQADARVWYDFCFLRYTTYVFYKKSDTGSGIIYWNANNVSDTAMFERKLKGVMDSARNQAIRPWHGGFGSDKVKLSPFITLYGMVQCTIDLGRIECAKCLSAAYANFQSPGSLCKDKQGCRVLYSSCYVRYEIYPFYFPLHSSPKPTPVSYAYLYPKRNL